MPLASSLVNIHDVQGAIWPANSHQLPLQTNFPGQILSCFSPSILFHVHLVSSRLKRTFLITWRLHCNRHTFHCSLSRSCCSFVLFHLQSRNEKKTRRRSNPRQGKTRFILQLGNNTTVENKFYYLSQFLAALPTDIPEDWRTRSDCRITSPTPKKSESNSNYFPIKCPISFHFTTHGAISSPNELVLRRETVMLVVYAHQPRLQSAKPRILFKRMSSNRMTDQPTNKTNASLEEVLGGIFCYCYRIRPNTIRIFRSFNGYSGF